MTCEKNLTVILSHFLGVSVTTSSVRHMTNDSLIHTACHPDIPILVELVLKKKKLLVYTLPGSVSVTTPHTQQWGTHSQWLFTSQFLGLSLLPPTYTAMGDTQPVVVYLTVPGSVSVVLAVPGSVSVVLAVPGSVSVVLAVPGSVFVVLAVPGSISVVLAVPG